MYVCRKLRLCSYLLAKGFSYVSTRPDRDNKKYTVWLFKNTPELQNAKEEYYSSDNFINRI